MSKKKYFGSDNIISIYRLMDICGLHCPVHGNIAVSHKIALRKLNLRHSQNPDSVVVPKLVPFKAITSEAVRTGRILLVRDDCKNICGYLRPVEYLEGCSVAKIYDDLFHSDSIYDAEPEQDIVETIKPGEAKYLRKRRHRDYHYSKLPYIDDLTPKDKEKIRKRLLSEIEQENSEEQIKEEKYNKRKRFTKEG